jgi:hypothetical protein
MISETKDETRKKTARKPVMRVFPRGAALK